MLVFSPFPEKSLYKGAGFSLSSVGGGHEIDVVLLLFHSLYVLLQTGVLALIIAGLEPGGEGRGREGGKERERRKERKGWREGEMERDGQKGVMDGEKGEGRREEGGREGWRERERWKEREGWREERWRDTERE